MLNVDLVRMAVEYVLSLTEVLPSFVVVVVVVKDVIDGC